MLDARYQKKLIVFHYKLFVCLPEKIMRSNITSSDNHSHKVEYEGIFSDEIICDKVLKLENGEMTFQIRQYRF